MCFVFKSRKLSDTPSEVQEKRMETLSRVLIVIAYFAREYQLFTAEHSCQGTI